MAESPSLFAHVHKSGREAFAFLPRVKFMRVEGDGWWLIVGRLFVKWNGPDV